MAFGDCFYSRWYKSFRKSELLYADYAADFAVFAFFDLFKRRIRNSVWNFALNSKIFAPCRVGNRFIVSRSFSGEYLYGDDGAEFS